MTDMASGEQITERAFLLNNNGLTPGSATAASPAAIDLPHACHAEYPPVSVAMGPSKAAAAIHEAMRLALEQNEHAIAERLFQIGALFIHGEDFKNPS
jgi:hypothetical protein